MRTVFLLFSLLAALLLLLPVLFCGSADSLRDPAIRPDPCDTASSAHTAQPMDWLSDTGDSVQTEYAETEISLQIPKDAAVETTQRMDAGIMIEEETQPVPLPSAAESMYQDDAYTVVVSYPFIEGEMRLSDYLIGILLAEIPAGFEWDAKCAQAVAARSYVLYRVQHGYSLNDTSCAYFTEERAREFYGDLYEDVRAAAEALIRATDGMILTYEGDVCCTAFHAMSYRSTENAEDIWGQAMPYLVSVSSPEAEDLAGMRTSRTFTEEELCVLFSIDRAFPVTMTTRESGGVETVQFGETVVDGAAVRKILHLRSSIFWVDVQDDSSVTIAVGGYGHGVGMSQYGAQEMALQGATWKEILAHYYQNTVVGTLYEK